MATISINGIDYEAPSSSNTADWSHAFTSVLEGLAAAITEESPAIGAWTEVDTEPAFEGDWANVGSGAAVAAFCTDGNFVYIKGSVIGGSGDIFVLPEELWPDELLKFPTNKKDTTIKADIVVVETDGTVSLLGTGGAAVEVYFGLIQFRLPE